MLYSTTGCQLQIANEPDAHPAEGCEWVTISDVESIGLLGVRWDVETADMAPCDADGLPSEMAVKSVMRRPTMPLIMANVPTDSGQSILWAASRSPETYPFRLIFADGVTDRRWSALVIGIGEVFDANSVMKLQVDLKPVSDWGA